MQKNGTDLNDLHSCWAGVCQELLACGRAEPVLAALDAAAAREDRRPQLLMTQQEALHLTEQAQNQGLQGMGICVCKQNGCCPVREESSSTLLAKRLFK